MADEEGTPLLAFKQPADTSQLSAYLLRVVPPLLGTEEDIPEVVTLQSILKDNDSKLKRFIEDSQEHTLSILYTLPLEEVEGSLNVSPFNPTFDVQLGVRYQPQRCVGVVFSKCNVIIASDKSVRSQLRFLTISEDSPFETLHAFIHDAMNPLFNSFIQQLRRDKR